LLANAFVVEEEGAPPEEKEERNCKLNYGSKTMPLH